MLEPAHFLALGQCCRAGHLVGPAPAQVQQHVEEVQPDAGDQDRSHRHQRQLVAALRHAQPDHRPFVAAEQALDPRQRDRIHVPGVAAQVGDMLDAGVVRRVEAVVHRRRQAQRDVEAALKRRRVLRRREQLVEAVRVALGLQHLVARDRAAGPDDGVARAGQDIGAGIERACTFDQLAREALVQRAEVALARVRQIQIGEQAPHRHRKAGQGATADAAEAPHQARQRDPRHPVGEQEVQILLLKKAGDCARFHAPVNCERYTGGSHGWLIEWNKP